MATKLEFNILFDKLASHQWEYFPEKERIDSTRDMYYDSLNTHSANRLDDAVTHFLKCNGKYLPTIPQIEAYINLIAHADIPKTKQAANFLFTPYQILHRKLFRRMSREARNIIKNYGNDRQRLAQCGGKYENMRRALDRMKNGLIASGVTWEDPANPGIKKIISKENMNINEVNYHGQVFKVKTKPQHKRVMDGDMITAIRT